MKIHIRLMFYLLCVLTVIVERAFFGEGLKLYFTLLCMNLFLNTTITTTNNNILHLLNAGIIPGFCKNKVTHLF